jgi:hypothetical protein
MRSIALFILCFLIFYSVYFTMNEKLKITEKDVIIKYKEVPKQLLEEQYTFNVNKYFDNIRTSTNLWKELEQND